MQEPIPGYNGGGNYLANVGRIDNKGIDFSINARLICKKRSRLLQQKRRCCYSSDVAKLMFSS